MEEGNNKPKRERPTMEFFDRYQPRIRAGMKKENPSMSDDDLDKASTEKTFDLWNDKISPFVRDRYKGRAKEMAAFVQSDKTEKGKDFFDFLNLDDQAKDAPEDDDWLMKILPF